MVTVILFLRGSSGDGGHGNSSIGDRILADPVRDDEGEEEMIPSNSVAQMTSGEMILWYCFVTAVIVPFVICIFYFVYHNHRSHRRALHATMGPDNDDDHEQIELDGNLQVIQQNIKAWSEIEKKRVTRIVRLSVRNNVKVRRCFGNWINYR
jgi:hypothetical protein